MGNRAQTAKALVQQADEALIVISEYWMQTIDATGGSEKAAERGALEAEQDGEGGRGRSKSNEAEAALASAKLQLKTSLLDITAALLGRNVSQATKKDRRATPEEKQEIADLITEGLNREVKKKSDSAADSAAVDFPAAAAVAQLKIPQHQHSNQQACQPTAAAPVGDAAILPEPVPRDDCDLYCVPCADETTIYDLRSTTARAQPASQPAAHAMQGCLHARSGACAAYYCIRIIALVLQL